MDHHERALRILREENRASASQLIAEETKRWREQLMDYESEVAHWKVRAEELEAQLRDAQLRLRDGRERQRGGRTPAKVDADLEDELAYAEGMPSDKENSGRPFDKENSGRRSRSQSRGYAAVPDHFTGASDNAELTALRNEVALLQSTQSPDAAQLQALLQKITTMEARFDRRDHAWRQLLARQRDETRDATERERQRYKAALKKKEAEVKRFRGEMDVVMRELEQLRK